MTKRWTGPCSGQWGIQMQPDVRPNDFNGIVLRYLYERAERQGPEAFMLSQDEWAELERRTGTSRPRIGRALEELADDGYADGPRLAEGLESRDGFIGLTPQGRRFVESWQRPPERVSPVRVEIAGFTPEAADQLRDLFSQFERTTADPAEVRNLEQLLLEAINREAPPETRLAKLSQAVGVFAGSDQLLTTLLVRVVPGLGELVRHLPS